MKVKPTVDGGRIAEGDTPWLRYRIVDGVVEVWEPRTPKPHIWTADEQATAAARVAVCEACEHLEGATVYRVKCGKCGCTGLSPLTGTCPVGKW